MFVNHSDIHTLPGVINISDVFRYVFQVCSLCHWIPRSILQQYTCHTDTQSAPPRPHNISTAGQTGLPPTWQLFKTHSQPLLSKRRKMFSTPCFYCIHVPLNRLRCQEPSASLVLFCFFQLLFCFLQTAGVFEMNTV